MRKVSVTNLDSFRYWRGEEELPVSWLMERLEGKQPETEPMRLGKAFHQALETANTDLGFEWNTLNAGDYRFDFNCDCELVLSPVREAWIEKDYNGLQVRGRVDSLDGLTVTDYKVTERFDPDRFLEGYQWRYYLDMTGADKFVWRVFVVSQFGPEKCYSVYQYHELSQNRYPGMKEDCERLAADFLEFAEAYLGATA